MKMVCPSTSSSSNGVGHIKFGVRSISKPNRFSKPVQSPAVTARRLVLRRIRKQEVKKLKALLPNVRQRRVDELMVVQEAVRYIDQLHSTIMARMYSGTLSYESVSDRLHPFTMQQIQNRFSHQRVDNETNEQMVSRNFGGVMGNENSNGQELKEELKGLIKKVMPY